jgi:8-oxo-dGTP diphosphatase
MEQDMSIAVSQESRPQESKPTVRPMVGVAAVVLHKGKILLSKRKSTLGNGFWSVAGGHLEYGESVEECARRELEEEAGIKALSLQLGPWSNNIISEGKHYITLYAYITKFEGEPECREPDKQGEWYWFDLENLPEPLFPTVASLVQQVGVENLKKIEF